MPPGEGAEAVAGANTAQRDDAEAYESLHVHGVYEAIAPHFSATRHKPWPFVAEFLKAQPPGAIGFDVGCGNGKYLAVNRDTFLVGSDRSSALVALARQNGEQPSAQGERRPGHSSKQNSGAAYDVLVADGLSLPFRAGSADFVICVAVIHHLSTRERRQDGIRQLLQCVRQRHPAYPRERGGEVLVYVWALEQASSRRGWDEGGDQDLLVPWVMKNQQQKKRKNCKTSRQAEGMEQFEQVHVEGPCGVRLSDDTTPSVVEQPEERTFQRYYHLYRQGELEEDVQAAGGEILGSGYERDNWWVIAATPLPS
ncbi:hypothetical protein VTK73DRAFT_8993 [Phialemonium thermophilum]|uniref:Methyltransferase type 11 domain-containing protein n=1 Tax=Phialemonium thermophilum TaxID=223376 RepID=A0ABR3XLQ1_9PEZI